MLLQPTLEKLRAMRLKGMARALELQLQQAGVEGLAFEERLGLIIDHEWACRQDRRLSRLLKKARLRRRILQGAGDHYIIGEKLRLGRAPGTR